MKNPLDKDSSRQKAFGVWHKSFDKRTKKES